MSIRRAFVERLDISAQKIFLTRMQLKKEQTDSLHMSSPTISADMAVEALAYQRARKFSISTFRYSSSPQIPIPPDTPPGTLKLSKEEQEQMLGYIRRRRLLRLAVYWLLHWFAGAFIFLVLEHHEDSKDQWSFLDSLFFTFATLTTSMFYCSLQVIYNAYPFSIASSWIWRYYAFDASLLGILVALRVLECDFLKDSVNQDRNSLFPPSRYFNIRIRALGSRRQYPPAVPRNART